MEKYDYFILIAIGLIALIGILAVLQKISDAWSTALIGIIVGVILFLVSVKLSKTSTSVIFVLFNDSLRKILEALDTEKSIAEIATLFGITGNSKEMSKLQANLNYLAKKNFVKKRMDHTMKKYSRKF